MNRSTYDKLLSNIDTLRAEFRDPENVDEEAVRELAARIFQLAHGYEARELRDVLEAYYQVHYPCACENCIEAADVLGKEPWDYVEEENDNG